MNNLANDVTIVMPVRKQTTYFRQALDSALAQTVPVKIIVHDSSPTNAGFKEIIGNNDRVEYHHFTDGIGIAGDWNRSMNLARTKWISFLHQDDILLPNALELLLEAKQKMPGRAIYFGLDDAIDESGTVRISKARRADGQLVEVLPQDYAIMNQFCAPGALIDRELALELGGFAPLEMTLDWDMWVRLTLHSGTVRINAITAQFREYFDPNRGTTVQELSGNKLLKIHVQFKRNLTRLKAKLPNYVPPPDADFYLFEMARGDLCVKGSRLTRRGRHICFAYILRRQRLIHSPNKRRAYLSAVFLSWLWISYSYVRPYREALGRFFGPAQPSTVRGAHAET